MEGRRKLLDVKGGCLYIFGSDESLVAQNNNLDTLWEPGKTQVAYLAIRNEGNLDLKYQVALNVTNPADGKDLYQAMRYAIVPNAKGNDAEHPVWTEGQDRAPPALRSSAARTRRTLRLPASSSCMARSIISLC